MAHQARFILRDPIADLLARVDLGGGTPESGDLVELRDGFGVPDPV